MPEATFTSMIGRVNLFWSDKKISAARNSFHELRKANMATVATPGSAIGSMIRRRIVACEAPSMRAASISAFGTASKALRIMKIGERKLEGHVDQHQPEQAVLQPQHLQDQEQRRQDRLERDHHRRHDQNEQQRLAGKAELRKAVARRHRDQMTVSSTVPNAIITEFPA
jgi:hypothetical protein